MAEKGSRVFPEVSDLQVAELPLFLGLRKSESHSVRRNVGAFECLGVSATDGCAVLTTLITGDSRARQADMGLGNPTPGRLRRSLSPPALTL